MSDPLIPHGLRDQADGVHRRTQPSFTATSIPRDGSWGQWVEECLVSAPSLLGPFEPVTVYDRDDGGHREGHEESDDAAQFDACQDGDDNREGM
jgi:hypothetical protein